MNNFTAECRYSNALALNCIKYCFQFIEHTDLQVISADIFSQIMFEVKEPLPQTVVDEIIQKTHQLVCPRPEVLKQFPQKKPEPQTCEHLIAGIFSIPKHYKSPEDVALARRLCFGLVTNILKEYCNNPENFSSGFDKQALVCTLKALESCFKSFDASREANENQRLISRPP